MAARREGPAGSILRSRTSGELATRVFSALLLAILALAAAYLGGPLLALFWLAAGLGVLVEWLTMTKVEPKRVLVPFLCAALVFLTIIDLASAGMALALLGAAVAIGSCLLLGRAAGDRTWAAAGFAYAAVISLVPPAVRHQPDTGLAWLLWMFAVVWTTDVVAYFVGRRFGGPKLWPRMSPKKTWSGFAGGLLGGTLAGCAIIQLALGEWDERPDWAVVAAVSALASVASQLGDLGESALKRRFDVKDSGHVIPGHGGVMDRVDGFWAVAALAGLWLLLTHLMPR
jgi:phosphatidate cytidylyltransferase